jgi:hypothetical protein
MFTDAFWSDVLSNLIPDFVIGVLIVGAISYINAKKEKREIEYGERKEKSKKTYTYMISILNEIRINSYLIDDYLKKADFSNEINLSSNVWEALIDTGELTTFVTWIDFDALVAYYRLIQEVNRKNSRIFETRLFENTYLEEHLTNELQENIQDIKSYTKQINTIVNSQLDKAATEYAEISLRIIKTNLLYLIQDFFKEKISNDISKIIPRFKEG